MDHDDDDGAPTSSPTSTKYQRDEDQPCVDGEDIRDRVVSFDSSAESTPRKSLQKSKPSTPTSQMPPRGQDLSSVDMKSSWDGSVTSGAGILADPAKIAKEREKEERVRQARERLMEERQKKLEELREQQKMAQENREKQLEMRRRKIEDLRKRDFERRIAVEERRKMKEEVERARRESILQKAEERVARYEAWKAGGRKGGRGHVLGFGSATPRDICQPLERPRRSSSQSALQRRSPNGSDLDSVRPQRRALSACSVVRRHVDSNRIGVFNGGDSPTKQLSVSTSVLYTKTSREYSSMSTLHPPSRLGTSVGTSTPAPTPPAATHYYPRPTVAGHGGNPLALASMTASLPIPVRMRETKSARKPRPASVASSMPSVVDGQLTKSGRSKSIDRTGRDRSRTRQSRKEEALEKNINGEMTQTEESQQNANEGNGTKEHGEKKEKKDRVSLSFSDRLSAPKHKKKDHEQTSKEPLTKKDAPIIRRSSLREKQSPTPTKDPGPKAVSTKDVHRGTTPTSTGPTPVVAARSVSPARKESDKSAVRIASPSHKGGADRSVTPTSFITPPPSANSTPTVQSPSPATLGAISTPSHSLTTSFADDGTNVSRGPTQDISADEYKARLAEKRRQAREKAEKEAEEERKRQEETRLAEDERQRREEEEEKRLEEESLRLAEEAQRVEEERLQKAIQAEEKRKQDEALKLEQEKKIKEEAERKARAETERLEKEKQEKTKKEEEERLERKRKLEMIMKRVKVDTESQPKIESPTKTAGPFPSVTHLSPSQSSPEEEQKSVVSSEASDEESSVPSVAEGSAVVVYSDAMTMSFMEDFEEADMTASTSSSTTTVTRSVSSGNILDGPTFRTDGQDHDSSATEQPHKIDVIPLQSENATVWSDIAQRLDEERQQKSVDVDKKTRKEEIENLEQERTPKEDRQPRTEIEQERQGRARKEDEERQERKKKLEMIMKRVKVDTESQPKIESPTKTASPFPNVTHFSPSQSSPEEEQKSVVSSEASDEESSVPSVAEGSAVVVYSDAMTMSFMGDFEEADMTASTSSSTTTVTRSVSSGNILDGPTFRTDGQDHDSSERTRSAGSTPSKPEEKVLPSETSFETKSRFKSPLLQHLVENKGGDSGGPKFKSPLLQNLLGKSKIGARMGLSSSVGDLSHSKAASSLQNQAGSVGSNYMTYSTSSIGSNGSLKDGLHHDQNDEGKLEFEHLPKSLGRNVVSNGIGRDSGDAHFPNSSSKSSFDSSPFETTKLFTPVMSDSALGSSIEPYGESLMSQSIVINGHKNYQNHALDDSSVFCVDEGVTKSASVTHFETLGESDRQEEIIPTHEDHQFEDLIDFGGTPGRTFEESSRSSITDYLS